ncbi:MAG TPA: hypothetical protein VIC57_16810 [Candidatus Dormibacteraeota bacterium]
MSGPEPDGQLQLNLEPAASAPPPCCFCQGRGWVPRSPLGWAACTWCDGASREPAPEVVEDDVDEELLPVEEWFVIDTRVYRVTAHGEAAALTAVGPDQEPDYHTTQAELVEPHRAQAAPRVRPVRSESTARLLPYRARCGRRERWS